jgi:predicted nucleic acid-binding protein
MPVVLLDTSVLVAVERELVKDEVGPFGALLGTRRGEEFACCTVTVGELAAGRSEFDVRLLLRRLRKISLSEAIAHRAGALDRRQRSLGQRLGENDTWIAATALHYSATLVYLDGDFDRVEGLKRIKLS